MARRTRLSAQQTRNTQPNRGRPIDTRLHAYRRAVRAMRQYEFRVPIPLHPVEDDVGRLGAELSDLAIWLDRRFHEYEKLLEVTEDVGGGIFIEEVLDRVFDTFQPLIPFDRLGYALLVDEGRSLRAAWARAKHSNISLPAGFSATMENSSLNSILQTGEPRILNDLQDHLATHPHSISTRLIVEEGVRSSLTCPLVAQGKPIGFLFFSSNQPNTYRDVHQTLFRRIAGQLSVLLEKSQMYQQLYDLNQKLVEAQEALRQQVRRDVVTGIWNRAGIIEFIEEELSRARRTETPLAIIMADVDHFKLINDEVGHLGGDAALRLVANAMHGCLRDYDRIGRFGGEEFLAVFPATNAEGARTAAERLRQAVSVQPLRIFGAPVPVTISLGVTLALASGDDTVETLIARADKALYDAKHAGRDCVRALID